MKKSMRLQDRLPRGSQISFYFLLPVGEPQEWPILENWASIFWSLFISIFRDAQFRLQPFDDPIENAREMKSSSNGI